MPPVIVTLIIAYAVSGSFMSVYDLSIDTILLCFCEDLRVNDGSAEKPYFMSDELQSVVGAHNKVDVKSKASVASEESMEQSKSTKEVELL